jgi:ATP-binding cassette, subfamily D (ALD), peroxisomal long-chain fatty acid import protein
LTVPAAPGTNAPGISDIFLVPQRIYMCSGSLADQLTYPKRFSKGERTAEQESKMMELLKLVGIDYLVERWQKDMPEGDSGWDYETKWEDVLSLGEQQRTGMARLFFHKPKFGVLDECAHCIPSHSH